MSEGSRYDPTAWLQTTVNEGFLDLGIRVSHGSPSAMTVSPMLEPLFRRDEGWGEKLPVLRSGRVVRERMKGGGGRGGSGHDEDAWRSASEKIRAAGFGYEEVETVGAEWLEGLDP